MATWGTAITKLFPWKLFIWGILSQLNKHMLLSLISHENYFIFLLHSFVVCVWGQLTPCAHVQVREDNCGSQVSATSIPEDRTLVTGLGGRHLAGPPPALF